MPTTEQIAELRRLVKLAKLEVSGYELFGEGWPGQVRQLMRAGVIDDLLAADHERQELRRAHVEIAAALERTGDQLQNQIDVLLQAQFMPASSDRGSESPSR